MIYQKIIYFVDVIYLTKYTRQISSLIKIISNIQSDMKNLYTTARGPNSNVIIMIKFSTLEICIVAKINIIAAI
jgi:hypothetical protein